VSGTFFRGGILEIIFYILRNPYLKYVFRPENKTGSWLHTEITPVLPISGQKFW
jgi:hypothetical protein